MKARAGSKLHTTLSGKQIEVPIVAVYVKNHKGQLGYVYSVGDTIAIRNIDTDLITSYPFETGQKIVQKYKL